VPAFAAGVVAFACMAAAPSGAAASAESDPARPNVIVVLIDTLRKDHLGCYGYDRATSPNIDRFAQDALRFERAFAQAPSTKPSVASLFTSRYPSQHNAIHNKDALNTEFVTLAEILKDAGYTTAAFLENHVIIPERYAFDQGFDVWNQSVDKPGENQAMLAWLEANVGERFFLYLHYLDPHTNYKAPAPYQNFFDPDYTGPVKGSLKDGTTELIATTSDPRHLEHLIAMYDDEIRWVDAKFGGFVAKLKELGLYDDSVLILLSDHGEGFMEHENLHHSYSVHGELLNVPWIIRYPKAFGRGVSQEPVQHIDLFPTLAGLLGIDVAALPLEGRNLLAGQGAASGIVSEHLRRSSKPNRERQRSLVLGDWKLVENLDSETEELYRIEADPLDRVGVSDQEPEVAERLSARLAAWEAAAREAKPPTQVELNAEIEANLRALGYLD